MQPRHGETTEADRLRALVTVAHAVSDAVADERRLAQLVVDLACRLVGDGVTMWLPGGDDDNTLARVGIAHTDAPAEPAPPMRRYGRRATTWSPPCSNRGRRPCSARRRCRRTCRTSTPASRRGSVSAGCPAPPSCRCAARPG